MADFITEFWTRMRVLRTLLAAAVLVGTVGMVEGQDETTSSPIPNRKSNSRQLKAKSVLATPESPNDASASTSDASAPRTEIATFGAGCFWHVESEFEWLPGVKSAISGYSGGNLADPTYEDVHDGWTGHAEVVRVEYDPAVISYEKLLRVFWSGHDPTQLDRQGPDFGTQYRSVIFYHTPEQRQAALRSYQQLTQARAYRAPIVTQLLAAPTFYPAEEYHQNYYGGKDGRAVKRKVKRPRKPTASLAVKAKNAKADSVGKQRASDDQQTANQAPSAEPNAGNTAKDPS